MNLPPSHCTCKPKIILFDPQSGQTVRPDCKTWRCPACARRKARRLAAATVSAFSAEPFVGLVTLTLSSTLFGGRKGIERHHEIMMGAWRRLVQRVRSGKALGEMRNGWKYLVVKESHQSAYVHLHIIMNKPCHWSRLQDEWERCLRLEMEYRSLLTPVSGRKFCNAKWSKKRGARVPQKVIVRYICKYLSKQRTPKPGMPPPVWKRVWTASRGCVRLYQPRNPETAWRVYTLRKWVLLEGRPILVSICRNVSVDSACLPVIPAILAVGIQFPSPT